MSIKKVGLSVIMLVIFVTFIMASITEVSGKSETPIYLGLNPYMIENPNFGYSINGYFGDNNVNDFKNRKAAKIWNIVKYASQTSSTYSNSENIYCLREGEGFLNSQGESNIGEIREYNESYDMKMDKVAIGNVHYWNNNIGSDSEDKFNQYDSILAVLDLFYISGSSTEEERKNLLDNAIGKYRDEEYSVGITDSDIKAVQQAALWYFTNYGENNNGLYDQTENTSWLNYTEDGENYKSLSDYKIHDGFDGEQRDIQVKMLYDYLIKTAKANAYKYAGDSVSEEMNGEPAKVNTTELSYYLEGDNYIVGPISISKQESIKVLDSIGMELKDKNGTIDNYSILKSSDKTNANTSEVKELVGEEFYISIPKNNVQISDLKVEFSINYSTANLRLWTHSTNKNATQPVVIPERKRDNVITTLDIETPEPDNKIFDLSLRKYITKINDIELEGKNSRVPVIESSTEDSKVQFSYKHKKTPEIVKKGDKVTYKLTIYNEGEKEGRATKIVDQLPAGLKFTKIVSGNFEVDSNNPYTEDTNTLYLSRKTDNEENLSAYTSGEPANETIEIECEVIANPDSENSIILTNVAWILEEFDAEENIIITNQEGADIDSEPETKPSVDKNNMSDYRGKADNKPDLEDSNYYYKGQQDDDDFEKLILMPETFDLKLIKRITAVNNKNVQERIENVDVSKLNTIGEDGKLVTTGEYKLNKSPVGVKKGDIITYTFRIYNEGTLDGYASEITEEIPEGLEFIWSEKEGDELKNDTTLTEAEKEAIEFNQKYLWEIEKFDDTREKIIEISSEYLSKDNETTVGENLIKAFGKNDGTKTEDNISYKEISVKLKVVSENETDKMIRNEACISEDTDSNGDPIDDRDSNTEEWVKYEDDEDYDYIILQSFDLALRKFIIAISDDTQIDENEYLKNEDGSYVRSPIVDASKLNTKDEDGNIITGAIYNHTKEPMLVKKNDIIIYMLRVYNEGDMDGYAGEIKDHLPINLEYVDSEFNKEYGWELSEDGRTATTKYLENSKISKVSENSDGKMVIAYKEVPIMCKIKGTAEPNEKITNIADITKYLDENKNPVTDRDSQPDNVVLPEDKDLPTYKDDEKGEYIPGQQDDDDYEKVIVKIFDLALRKFIVAVSNDTQIDENECLRNEDGSYSRAPIVDTSKLNTKDEDGNIITGAIYNHTKEPILVKQNDIIIYMLRVYNEGDMDGYAGEIKDHLPMNLEYVDSEFNKEYGWTISEDGRTATTKYLEDSKISRVSENSDGEIVLEYKEVPIMCKIKRTAEQNEKITNIADITKYLDENKNPVTDRDSQPDNVVLPEDKDLPTYKDDEKGEYIPGQQDDDDYEKVIVKVFDLALRKWVTQAIVIENGQENITNTGHQPWDDPEQIVKVEIHRKKLNQVTVKFKYSIRIINQGDIEGYAKEVTDYIPEGLKFVAADNPGWTDEGNNVISTRLLENTLLKPGEYADVEVLLTWENNENNMGLKVNTAEISEDYNEYDLPDKDSTPDNKKEGEDDIDDAPVMLSIATGQIRIYFMIGLIVLITVAGGVVLIKKYVL